MKSSILLLLALTLAFPVLAQEQVQRQKGQVVLPQPSTAGKADLPAVRDADDLPVIHVTDILNNRPDIRAATEAFAQQRRRGPGEPFIESAGKTAADDCNVGTAKTFKVMNFVKSTSTTVMDQIDFTAKAKTSRFCIWVQTSELNNNHVRDQDIEALRAAMQERTPAGSINPQAGIIVNDQTLFGTPPDVDGNGISDILLVDIQDGWDGGGYIGGFVLNSDVTSPGAATSNGRDILYLDTYPGLWNGGPRDTRHIEGTAAHEYQHLIHLNYDEREETFVNEGLSEYAEIANGYVVRNITYLGNPDEHNRPFLDWRSADDDGVLQDYERAGLFTTYVAERIGAAETGKLVQAGTVSNPNLQARGASAYDSALRKNGLSMEEILIDFHLANLINDPDFLPPGYTTGPYAYRVAGRQAFDFVPANLVDGLAETTSAVTDFDLNQGAVYYHTWEHVTNLRITADVTTAGTLTETTRSRMRDRLRLRAVIDSADGTRRVAVLEPGVTTLSGTFERVTLAVIDSRPSTGANTASIDINASWAEHSDDGSTTETFAYDTGNAITGKFFSLAAAAQGAQATRFSVPPGNTRLSKVEIAPYFLNQFSDSEGQIGTPQDPRDVTLKVWSVRDDGTPGDELFALPWNRLGAYSPVTGTNPPLRFVDVDLSDYAGQLSNLPAQVFVGFAEAGTDANYMVVAVSQYATENVSFVMQANGQWGKLWDVKFQNSGENDFPLRSTVIPVRAQFVTTATVATEGPDEVPQAIALGQNYPNPFNPTTAIQYSLPQSATVKLSIYDVLGRHMATLVDGVEPAGTHEVRIDATEWASGLYVYVLEAGQQTLTKKMLLVK